MAGLADLAQGLRLAGGVLSPRVAEANVAEDRLRQQQAHQMQLAQIQQTVKGIEMGAIEPEAGRAALKQMGFDVPVGPGIEAMKRQEELTQRRQMVEAMKKLPPDARQEQRLAAMAPYMTPEQQIRLYDTTVNKAATLEAQLDRMRMDYELRSRTAQRQEDKDLVDARFKAAELDIKQQIADLKAISGATGDKAPSGYRFTSGGGSLEAIPGGPADKPPGEVKTTEGERSAAGYLHRMVQAEQLMSDPRLASAQAPGVVEAGLRGLGMGTTANFISSDARQSARNAQMEWVRAKLRKESGAVIGKEEMDEEIRTYFPQVGDREDVIRQKAGLRRNAIEQMRIGAGHLGGTGGALPPGPAAPAAAPAPAPAAPPTGLLGVTGANPSTQITIGGRPVKPSMPSTGDVEDGYRFKGGDPSKKSNWEKI